jgi:hypothetical protein
MRFVVALACAGLLAGTAQAQMSSEQAKAIAGDPVAKPEKLKLEDVPAASGPAQALFNGRDLSEWEAWLGYADPGLTYTGPAVKPLGHDPQGAQMFSVVTEDGAPALRVDGRIWGSLVHKADLANYHLSLEFKWGDQVWAPRLTAPQNNGLLFHSGGRHGAVFGTWMRAMEFEIMRGSTGMVVPVGPDMRVRTRVAQDMKIIYPHRRFRLDGKPHDLKNDRNPDWNVEAAVDAEKPVGQWNKLDLYVLEDDAVFVVNGVPVMVLTDIALLDREDRWAPMRHGRIQLQSEGAETFFRNIVVEPIKSLPRVVAVP